MKLSILAKLRLDTSCLLKEMNKLLVYIANEEKLGGNLIELLTFMCLGAPL